VIVRLVEIRLLEGPNVYRLEPVVKVEVGIGRDRPWSGARSGRDRSLVHLGRTVPSREWPDQVADLVAWARRLRADHREQGGPVEVHRSSDTAHWAITWPWRGAERARTIAAAAVDLAARSVSSGRRVRLTNTQSTLLGRWETRIEEALATPPTWVRDEERSMPVISVTGTNGKSTVTRLITHILVLSGRHVGSTTSDGILVDERMVDAGDWTGPGGAAAILGRGDVDLAVLETARGGLVLRGLGYESNDASVFTNVSSDHLDLQGIHTLAELAEVKSTVCRVTRPAGWTILNADDPLVSAVARRTRARVALFSHRPESPDIARHRARGGRAYVVRREVLIECDGASETAIVPVAELPVALGGLARHNVANALAAAAGARAIGATVEDVAAGLRDFRASTDHSPGRLNVFRLGRRTVIVDFAHNEAGTEAILDTAAGIASGAAGRAAPVTAIIGTAGDRPDDTLRGIGRIAATRAQRVAIKETLRYLRGRDRHNVIEQLREGIRAGGMNPDTVPVYETEAQALEAELGPRGSVVTGDGRSDAARVVVLFCHAEREDVFGLLDHMGARQLDASDGLHELAPRLADRQRAREPGR
jgi:cyanophycin synthetase